MIVVDAGVMVLALSSPTAEGEPRAVAIGVWEPARADPTPPVRRWRGRVSCSGRRVSRSVRGWG